MKPDFEAEGLLAGLPDDAARAARLELLEDLNGRGVPLDQLRRAVEDSRLVLLPAEIALGGGADGLTGPEVAVRAGVEATVLVELIHALGLPLPAPDERAYDEDDVAAAERAKTLLGTGLPPESFREVTRVIGRAMSQVAGAVQGMIGDAMVDPGADELTVARRFEAAARELGPLMGPALGHAFTRHLREGMRNLVITQGQLAAGNVAGAREVAVCFVDIVGFTKLGEQVPAEELGDLASRLGELAAESVASPARLVKTIGDAAMLVSTAGPDGVIDGALALIESARAEGAGFPPVRAGIAAGPALGRSGDWYGPPVNLASRVTAVARPDSVLVTEEARDRAEAEWRWSFAGSRRLKGIPGAVPLHRARRVNADEQR